MVRKEDAGVHSTSARWCQSLSAWAPRLTLGECAATERVGIPDTGNRDPGVSVGETGMKTDDKGKDAGSKVWWLASRTSK